VKRRALTERSAGGTFHANVSRMVEEIQAADRLRLLDPTSLPKILRGRAPFTRPDTASISSVLLERMKARLLAEGFEISDDDAARYFRGEL
jgi:hypothetical protein